MDNLISFLIASAIIGAFLLYYLKQEKKKAAKTLAAAEKGSCAPMVRNRNIRMWTTPLVSVAPLARWFVPKAMSSEWWVGKP